MSPKSTHFLPGPLVLAPTKIFIVIHHSELFKLSSTKQTDTKTEFPSLLKVITADQVAFAKYTLD